ncbi:hypothetical protein GCM10017577_33600 [Pseudonocardia halophobica]|uniref:SHOCT domain-containing protein n=2 Tax=Pseudonocardia halophobica TaxID=29401 RepID=A0A9W6L703_9PSEU|nr:hypothetical protein GCM10017577_33600 [Pseudonocardia halophobica]
MWGVGGMTTIWLVAVILVLVAAAVGAAAGAALVARRGITADDIDPDRARRILDERLAMGEIDVAEHERVRAALEHREPSGS